MKPYSCPSGGGGFIEEVHDLTLADGAATITTALKRFRVLSIVPNHASSITAETFGAIGTKGADGAFGGGSIVIKSSGGSSTTTITVTLRSA